MISNNLISNISREIL